MNLNWSEGLHRLGVGMGDIAAYYANRESQDRQDRRDAANKAFEERIRTMEMEHADKLQAQNQDFLAKQQTAQIASAEKISANSLAERASEHDETVKYQNAQLAQAKAQIEQQNLDRDTKTQIDALSLQYKTAVETEAGLRNNMEKELEALRKRYSSDPAFIGNTDAQGKAEDAITQRYQPQFQKLSEMRDSSLGQIYDHAGIKVPGLESLTVPSADGNTTNPVMDLAAKNPDAVLSATPQKLKASLQAQYPGLRFTDRDIATLQGVAKDAKANGAGPPATAGQGQVAAPAPAAAPAAAAPAAAPAPGAVPEDSFFRGGNPFTDRSPEAVARQEAEDKANRDHANAVDNANLSALKQVAQRWVESGKGMPSDSDRLALRHQLAELGYRGSFIDTEQEQQLDAIIQQMLLKKQKP